MHNKHNLFTAIFTLILILGVSTSSLAADATSANAKKVIATVNGSEIHETTLILYQRRRGMPKDADPAQQRKAILEELINMELLYQDALKKGADKTPEFEKAIKAELEHLKKNMLASYMLTQRSNTTVLSDDDMKNEYEKRKPEMSGKEYKASHILVEKEKDAKDVIAALNKGADFAKLAKEKSIGPSATHGGDLGWFAKDQMVKEFSAAVAKMKKGKYSKQPVKTQYGYHVILKADERSVAPPPFETMKEQLRMRLRNKVIENYIGELRNKAKIEKK